MSEESLQAEKQWPDHGPTYRDWVDYVIRNSSHATQVLTPGGWSEWDAGRYARQQYEDMQRDKAATGEMLKKALLRCDELATRLATATAQYAELSVALMGEAGVAHDVALEYAKEARWSENRVGEFANRLATATELLRRVEARLCAYQAAPGPIALRNDIAAFLEGGK